MLIAVRDTVEEDSLKRNPFDFGLWFTVSKFDNQIMKWDSPWGVGYPGWHIECSGIAYETLGEYVDIHCGGVDNIFPHHTNEIAQSEAFLGHKWCNYWCHGAHLNDQSGKMSKSKGEFLTLSLLISKGYSAIDYRYFCLNSHYRNTLVFSYDSLDIAKNSLSKLKKKVATLTENGLSDEEAVHKYKSLFALAISNDLNTSQMITLVYDVLKDSELNDATKVAILKSFDSVLSLGLFEEDVENEISISDDLKQYIENKIEERNQAKKNKDFEKADSIRKELLAKNIKLIDTREGTTYEME